MFIFIFLDDEYELIRKASHSPTRSHKIHCSACQRSKGLQSSRSSVDELREITGKTVTERMELLIKGCRSDPLDSLPRPSTSQEFSVTDPREDDVQGGGDVLPQVDGINDSASADDGDSVRTKRTKAMKKGKPDSGSSNFAWLSHPSISPPPTHAAWLVEHLDPKRWITPVRGLFMRSAIWIFIFYLNRLSPIRRKFSLIAYWQMSLKNSTGHQPQHRIFNYSANSSSGLPLPLKFFSLGWRPLLPLKKVRWFTSFFNANSFYCFSNLQ